MAKLFINEKNKKGHISRRSTGIFRSIWADVSMRGCMWERIPIFLT